MEVELVDQAEEQLVVEPLVEVEPVVEAAEHPVLETMEEVELAVEAVEHPIVATMAEMAQIVKIQVEAAGHRLATIVAGLQVADGKFREAAEEQPAGVDRLQEAEQQQAKMEAHLMEAEIPVVMEQQVPEGVAVVMETKEAQQATEGPHIVDQAHLIKRQHILLAQVKQ